jgi:hypothetical protein
MRTSLDIVTLLTALLLARFAALLKAFHQRLIEQPEK